MKYKLIILNTFFIIFSVGLFAQGGANCSLASASPVNLPFSASNQTTCGNGNVYNSGNSTVCGNGVYLDGEDYLYVFTPNTSGLININITSTSSWVGLFLYQGCPSTGLCVSSSTSSSGNQSLSNISVTAGVTYYIVIDNWSVPTCIASFGINISAPTVAPTPTVQDCLGAIAVCQNVYSEANAYSGTGNIPNEINSGPSCLGSGEKNDVWYTFTTQTAGNVCFTIDPNVNSDDYDWAVYNLTSNSCSDIYNNAALEVSCNYSGTSGNTGPNGNSGSQNEPCIPVQVGQTYVVNVSQFSTSTNGYTIDFGASTASIFDNVPPSLQAISSTIKCGMTSLSFNFSENVSCSGILESDFELNGPGGPYTISSIIGSSCNSGASQDRYFTVSVTPAITDPGTYSFCVANTSSSISDLCGNLALPGCINFDIVYPTAEAGVPDTLTCTNPQVVLNGAGSSSGNYNWGTIGGNVLSGQNTLTPTVNQTGTYIIEVNSNDCISRDTVQIYQDTTLPVVVAGMDTSLTCVNDTIQLSGFVSGNNIVYYWTGASIASGDSTLNPFVVGPGVYTLTAVDTLNNCQLSSSLEVFENRDLPYTYAGPDLSINCNVDTVILNGSSSIAGSEYTYQWTDLSENVVSDSIYGSTFIPGTFVLTVSNTINSCQSQDTMVVVIDTIPPIANAGADTSLNCATLSTGVPVNGVGSQSGVGISYLWSTSNGNIVIGGTSNYALVNQPGTYTITVTNNNSGCQNSDDVVVVIDTVRPVANAGPDVFINCNNTSANLDGTASSIGGNILYQWSGPFLSSGATTNSAIANGAGTYTLTVTNSSNQCVKTDIVVVTSDLVPPGANAGTNTSFCSNQVLNLNGSSTNGDEYLWTTNDGNILSGSTTLAPIINQGGTYTLTVTDTSNGCQSVSNVMIGEIFVSAIIGANPITGQMPLDVDFINLGVADSSYWNFGNGQTLGDSNNISSSSITYSEQGDYVVTLISFNGQCSDTNRILIEVIGTSMLVVPNVFTPNGDGKNDVFEFMYRNITDFDCVIFNRWGKQVVEITSPDKSWNGKVDGAEASDGTYFYIIKAKGMDDVDYNLKGTVSLIR